MTLHVAILRYYKYIWFYAHLRLYNYEKVYGEVQQQ